MLFVIKKISYFHFLEIDGFSSKFYALFVVNKVMHAFSQFKSPHKGFYQLYNGQSRSIQDYRYCLDLYNLVRTLMHGEGA